MFRGRVVHPGEPLWLDEDQDEIKAYRRERGRVCGGCGTHPDDGVTWVPVLERCTVCQDLERARKDVPDGPAGFGVHVGLITLEESNRRDEQAEAGRRIAEERREMRDKQRAAALAARKARRARRS